MSRSVIPRAVPLALALLVGLSPALACRRAATQLLVRVDTDAPVPEELGFLRALVRDAAGELRSSSDFELVDVPSSPPAKVIVPFTFGVVPLEDDAARRVTVELEAYDRLDGTLRIVRRATTGFIADETLLLDLFLPRACVEAWRLCGPGETCTEQGCAPEELDPEQLERVQPRTDVIGRPRRDGGTPPLDASSLDAEAADATPPDATAPDATSPDGGGGSCGTSCPATCAAAECCAVSCPGGVCPTCGAGCACDVTCQDQGQATCETLCEAGATCQLRVGLTERGRLRCEAGASCALTCAEVDECALTCRPGAACLFGPCDAGAGCTMECPSPVISCAGGVSACNRPCP